jgi:hypothetical protein
MFGRLDLPRKEKKILAMDNVTFYVSSEPSSSSDTFYVYKLS